ncbi:MAG: type III pantothenate kinase [Planctomycetes bacterium]|nr:type III pantothenate kinase [Planctomycetota bacterium]
MSRPRVILLADIGNRFLKLGTARGAAGVEIDYCLPASPFLDLGGIRCEPPPDAVCYASVNPAGDAPLEAWARACFGLEATKLGRDRPIPLATRCRGAGADRLLNALAAVERFPGGAICVDVGTAVTVDAVSPDREFLGGAILPGPLLGAWALAARTAQLFEVSPTAPERAIARDTEEAIRSGLHHGTIGGVARLVERFREELAFEPVLVLTGGDVGRYVPAFPEAVHVPALTLEGILAAVR